MARLTDQTGSGPIDLEGLASDAGLRAQSVDQWRIAGGFELAKWVLALVAFVLLLIAAYAWLTYPDETMVAGMVQESGKRIDAYERLREGWYASVKDLLQLLVVSLLIPLLATLVGYIFGSQMGRAPDSG